MPKDDLDIKSSALKKKSSKSEKSIENTEIQIKKAKEYMKKINSQLTNKPKTKIAASSIIA